MGRSMERIAEIQACGERGLQRRDWVHRVGRANGNKYCGPNRKNWRSQAIFMRVAESRRFRSEWLSTKRRLRGRHEFLTHFWLQHLVHLDRYYRTFNSLVLNIARYFRRLSEGTEVIWKRG